MLECYTTGWQSALADGEVFVKQICLRVLIGLCFAISTILASQTSAYASDPRVSGGGIVDGDLGTTSQLGFTASSSGGEFLCVMAGRSGGFSFGPWASIAQMRVHGTVTGPVTISGGVASFSGTATIHVVGRSLESGDILTATVPSVPFTSLQTAGGAGVATHRLEVTLDGSVVAFPDLSKAMAPLSAGHITIRQ